VAAIEIVSPANKDRPEHRRKFVAKCAALLQQGVSVWKAGPIRCRLGTHYQPCHCGLPLIWRCHLNWRKHTRKPAERCEFLNRERRRGIWLRW
jgi:hypothetical protein